MAQDEDKPNNVFPAAQNSRRGFLATGVGVLGAGLAATVLGPAAAFMAYPLQHETTEGSDALVPVGDPSNYGEAPVKVELMADKVDAWNRVVQVKVGAAWVLRRGGRLVAFSSICPHAGCGIDYNAEKNKFLCACHMSWFSLDGAVEAGDSPRGLDLLETTADEKLVTIRYQRFKTGIPEKEPA